MRQASSNPLSQELAALSDGFADLAERLLQAARQLHAPGAPPPQDLIDELAAVRLAFEALRDRARHLAESLHVAPADGVPDSLQRLTALLDEVAEAETRRDRVEECRRRALTILDRVLSLSHTSDPDFAPLVGAQDQARALRTAIADASRHEPHDDTERLAEGDHAFSGLLALVEDHDDLSDDRWAILNETITEAFGRPLAIAAARSKLAVGARDDAPHTLGAAVSA
jgi:hypothetical protein